MRIIRTQLLTGMLIGLAMLVGGCQSAAEQKADQAVLAYSMGNYDQARILLEPLARQTDENFVLNNARLGSTALLQYRLSEAQDAFLRAYEVINSVGVNDGGRSLGAALIDEKIKVWKGEPFERVMVNFYLGLIYYAQHDYANARAAFENALFKLRDYGTSDDKSDKYSEVESNFTLGYIMLGKSWQRLGEPEKAQSMFDRAVKLRPDLAELANAEYNQESNLLLVVDWGQGPQKQTNYDGAIVGFGPKPLEAGPIYLPRVVVDGRSSASDPVAKPAVDLLGLAQDRRWESIDTIRTIKTTVGTGLMVAGAYEATRGRDRDTGLGVGLLAAGLLLKATSHADMRQWEMLPRSVFVIPLKVPAGVHTVTVAFRDGSQQTWHNLPVAATGETTYYMHMTPWTTGEFSWPPPSLTAAAGPVANR
ncbi:MAG: tetratricopeptide repeat protein [Planctomycetota bacterium]|nr:tetratricopeptide repeat protein [Planctomycetota bacterium]